MIKLQDDAHRLGVRARSWNNALLARPGDLDLSIEASRIEGRVPAALTRGRLLSNGPGWTKVGDRLAHPFDGHGYVRAFSFEADGSVRLRARFVDTPTYREELSAGRLVRRGLGTNPSPHFWKNIVATRARNVANTTVQRWSGKLLAAWEGGAPYSLDADSLETHGEETFGGVIAGQATLAHMKLDEAMKRLVTCSVKLGRTTSLTFREFDEAGKLVHTRDVDLPSSLFIHDFVITPHWYGLFSNLLSMKFGTLGRVLLGGATLVEAITTDLEAPGALYLVPRTSDAPLRTVTLPDRAFAVHYGNAFERDGAVYLDACLSPDIDFASAFGFQGPTVPIDPARPDADEPGRLFRVVVQDGADRGTWTQLAPHGLDFPRVHPAHDGRETPVLFGAARAALKHGAPFDSVVRKDLMDLERPADVWTAPENVFVGEPIFAPAAEREDEGHLLAMLYDGLREVSTLAIFDAKSLSSGPVARIPMPLMPYAFHGAWDEPAGS
ncbi:carotenoid oxygenase family protein [Archangium violaceum]|uniref:carotenoid oxygenase family protein n=1 Tax=Archangium violaceum TaxID=83451 RepID=UPI0019520C87|nr:carotenoid oxygenase family protein [Archangium violaceum]QRO02052.1 carotenoid oxygenase family protein [Archangium violaceum]